jgi:hypothetical protein
MPATTPCPQCQTPNHDGSRFCVGCGASLAPELPCPACNALNPLGNRFCLQCGSSLAGATWSGAAAGGAVVDGVWERGADEFVRRVDPEDARRFLGGRVVRVPPGSIGVVVVDGVVDRILPPGERTTLGLFERVANFFLRRDRTAFFLVDQRPIPIPFIVHTRPTAEGRTVRTQLLASFFAPRGDRQALGIFLTNVVGARQGMGASDLYNLLRPDVVRVAQDTLLRLATEARDDFYSEAEARIRDALTTLVTPRYGLTVEATVAPLTSVQSATVHLGLGESPRTRPCVSCRRELPTALRFCDGCGASQPTVKAPTGEDLLFTSDGREVELDLVVRVQGPHDDVGAARDFGARITPSLAAAAAQHVRTVAFAALASSAGFAAAEQAMREAATPALEALGLSLVELSLIDARDKSGAWVLGARADLERQRTDLTLGREFLAARDAEIDLEQLTLAQVLRAQSMRRGAAFEAKKDALEAGRREAELARDDAFLRDEQTLADRARREALAQAELDLAVAKARREGASEEAIAALRREADLRRRGEQRDDRREGRDDQREDRAFQMEVDRAAELHRQGLEATRRASQAEAERLRGTLDAERRRQDLTLELEALRGRSDLSYEDEARRKRLELTLREEEDRIQLAKVAAMAALDEQLAAAEHARELEKRAALAGLSPDAMIAMQAAELAKGKGGGAAWAQALSAHAELAAERRHQDALGQREAAHRADVTSTAQAAIDAMARVAASRAEAAPVVAGGAPVVTVGGPSLSTAAPARPCRHCGAAVRVDAKFCGACGTAEP